MAVAVQQAMYDELEGWVRELSRGEYFVEEVLELVAEQLARDADPRKYVGDTIRPHIWQPGEATD